MSIEPDEMDEDGRWFGDDPDGDEHEFECGAWINGKFDYYNCQLAGTEDCDWECPHSATVRGLRK